MKPRLVTRMSFVTAFRMMAALVAIVAQLGVTGASVLDARLGASAASHLESGGTNLHFAHNEADCFMCRAQHLGDGSPFNAEPYQAPVPSSSTVAPRDERVAAFVSVAPQNSRAPPAIV